MYVFWASGVCARVVLASRGAFKPGPGGTIAYTRPNATQTEGPALTYFAAKPERLRHQIQTHFEAKSEQLLPGNTAKPRPKIAPTFFKLQTNFPRSQATPSAKGVGHFQPREDTRRAAPYIKSKENEHRAGAPSPQVDQEQPKKPTHQHAEPRQKHNGKDTADANNNAQQTNPTHNGDPSETCCKNERELTRSREANPPKTKGNAAPNWRGNCTILSQIFGRNATKRSTKTLRKSRGNWNKTC